jgi:ATP synthase protein I
MNPLARVQPIDLLLKIQIVTLILIGFVFLLWQGASFAVAGSFGAAITLSNTWLQRKHLILAAEFAKADASKNVQRAYRCVVERWVMTFLLFAVGLFLLGLAPLPMLAGFIIAQLTLILGYIKRV